MTALSKGGFGRVRNVNRPFVWESDRAMTDSPKLRGQTVSRRQFLEAGAATAGAAGLIGFDLAAFPTRSAAADAERQMGRARTV